MPLASRIADITSRPQGDWFDHRNRLFIHDDGCRRKLSDILQRLDLSNDLDSTVNLPNLLAWDNDSSSWAIAGGGFLFLHLGLDLLGKERFTFRILRNSDTSPEFIDQFMRMYAASRFVLLDRLSVEILEKNKQFRVLPDASAHEYIYSTKLTADMSGPSLKRKRQKAESFAYTHPSCEVVVKRIEDANAIHIMKLYDNWANGNLQDEGNDPEKGALLRMISSNTRKDIFVTEVWLASELIAFSIDEKSGLNYF